MATNDDFPPVILTVDCVLMTLAPNTAGLSVALLERDAEPFRGWRALPGGYVHAGEDADLDDSARRVLAEKLRFVPRGLFLEQLYTVSGNQRDPRGWSATVVYYGLVPADVLPLADGAITLQPVDALPELAFDHAAIVAQAVARLRTKTGYSNLPGFLLGETFTLPELQSVYEQVLGQTIDQSVFRKRMDELRLIEAVADGFRTGGRHRPAQLYRLSQSGASLHDRTIAQRPRRRGGI